MDAGRGREGRIAKGVEYCVVSTDTVWAFYREIVVGPEALAAATWGIEAQVGVDIVARAVM